MQENRMIWRPYLPEPRQAYKLDPGDPEPVPLSVLGDLRALCAGFRVPPRQFRRRTSHGIVGSYRVESDIVAVDPSMAACEGMGGEDGYYAMLVHELLHATGHPTRLDRATIGRYSGDASDLEEGTVYAAQRLVLTEVGFPPEAVAWYAPSGIFGFPVDAVAAKRAAGWVLGRAPAWSADVREEGGPATSRGSGSNRLISERRAS
jgi:zincin-like metallopeptidase